MTCFPKLVVLRFQTFSWVSCNQKLRIMLGEGVSLSEKSHGSRPFSLSTSVMFAYVYPLVIFTQIIHVWNICLHGCP